MSHQVAGGQHRLLNEQSGCHSARRRIARQHADRRPALRTGPVLQDDDCQDAKRDEDELAHRVPVDAAAVEGGDEIGHRDVEEVPRGESENVGHRVGRAFDRE
jgi:hypothetical protein